jgi:hypothetical protein
VLDAPPAPPVVGAPVVESPVVPTPVVPEVLALSLLVGPASAEHALPNEKHHESRAAWGSHLEANATADMRWEVDRKARSP